MVKSRRTWTLDELEILPDKELLLLIPEDINKQFGRLPRRFRLINIKGLKVFGRTPSKFYTIIEGDINLLNGDKLHIKEIRTQYSGLN